ncbi:MAG TPA: hypothetical protein VFZ32_14610 [Micromonosporaceae bacterium]
MDWLTLLGWGGSVLVVVSLLQTRILRLRLLNLAGSVVLTGFNAAIGVWPMVGLNLVLSVVNTGQLWRLLRHRHDHEVYAVVEVDSANPYLRHVLASHRADILRFNPDFPIDDLDGSRRRHAFLVQWGERTAGVVLAHDAGGGTAQVDLDYVLPEYRDFTPGEFVYRRSDVFAGYGFSRVLAPRGMRRSTAYLRRVGFRSEGGALVLRLPDTG